MSVVLRGGYSVGRVGSIEPTRMMVKNAHFYRKKQGSYKEKLNNASCHTLVAQWYGLHLILGVVVNQGRGNESQQQHELYF